MCRNSGSPVASIVETAQVGGPLELKDIKVFLLPYTQQRFISVGIKYHTYDREKVYSNQRTKTDF